jgi:predicted amidophosphoribosyltransferase
MANETIAICPIDECNFGTEDVYDRNCGDCGTELISECPECKARINYSGPHCTKCGVKMKHPKDSVYKTRGNFNSPLIHSRILCKIYRSLSLVDDCISDK